MNRVPQIVPMSDLRLQQSVVMTMMNSAPVYLAQRGRPIGVLVSVEQWNGLQEELDDLQCGVAALKAELDIATGKDQIIRMTAEELDAWVENDEKVPA
jgi:prevent-host-death family protein